MTRGRTLSNILWADGILEARESLQPNTSRLRAVYTVQCTGTLSIQWDASGHTSLCESNIGNVKINPFLMIMRKEIFQTSKPKINF